MLTYTHLSKISAQTLKIFSYKKYIMIATRDPCLKNVKSQFSPMNQNLKDYQSPKTLFTGPKNSYTVKKYLNTELTS